MIGERGARLFLAALSLTLVTLSGTLCLSSPFWGDQALFTVIARELSKGAVLYRDLFDIKQPGIFGFYVIGGSLFGFTENGIHLFELLYWIGFSVLATPMLRPYFATHWAAALVPAFTIAVYYLYAGLLDLTQIEILVGFPLLLAWWLMDGAEPATRRGLGRYAGAGLAAAAVVLLKYLYVLIVLAFLGQALFRLRRRGLATADVTLCLTAFAAGLSAPLLVVFAYFAHYGQLGRIWWAYFEMAPAAHMLTPRPLRYLMDGARRFMIGHAPFLLLAVVGSARGLQEPHPLRARLITAMIHWIVVGAVAFIGLQGWPEYKWPLFTIPVGVLAVVGVEALWREAARSRWRSRTGHVAVAASSAVFACWISAPVPHVQTRLLGALLIGAACALGKELRGNGMQHAITYALSGTIGVCVGLAAIGPVNKIRVVGSYKFGVTSDARTRLQLALSEAHRAADADLNSLRLANPLPGPLHVFGHQILLLRAGRSPAGTIAGWGPEFLDERAWREMYSGLRSTRPPYIVVDPANGAFVRRRYPAIMNWIDATYTEAFVGASGTWYVRREDTPPRS
jgi:hypothetical protein